MANTPGECLAKPLDDGLETLDLVLIPDPQLHASSSDLDQAIMAGDRPGGRKTLNTVKERTKRPTHRVEDPDTSTSSSPLLDIPLPNTYDGIPDQRAFDAWAYEVTIYFKYRKLSDNQVMRMFHHLVSGEALSCFMTHFAPSRYLPSREQSLKEVLKVLQRECFPPDHKMTLHKQLMSATQGNFSVRGFVSELRFRAKHLPYVSEKCLAAIFFVGVHKYIRIRLIRDGMGQDDTDLETLKEYAQRYEYARRLSRDYRSEIPTHTILSFPYDISLQTTRIVRPGAMTQEPTSPNPGLPIF